jgi:hypothetical protein
MMEAAGATKAFVNHCNGAATQKTAIFNSSTNIRDLSLQFQIVIYWLWHAQATKPHEYLHGVITQDSTV